MRATTPAALLTIAGFDPSNGAGITADLQVFAAHRFFGVSAVTALTVQSTQGVLAVDPVSRQTLRQTLDFLVDDIKPQGIKIGLLPNRDTVEEVGSFLEDFVKTNPHAPIVFDPVLRPSSGVGFLDQEELDALHMHLLGRVTWLTPNWKELSALAEMPVGNLKQVEAAMRRLLERYPQLGIVVTGGDCDIPTELLLTPRGELHRLTGQKVATTSTHGTGCAFSSAFVCDLVGGKAPAVAAASAKSYVVEALRQAPGIGKGNGPMGLLWPLLVR